jgi:hypothetical protein
VVELRSGNLPEPSTRDAFVLRYPTQPEVLVALGLREVRLEDQEPGGALPQLPEKGDGVVEVVEQTTAEGDVKTAEASQVPDIVELER